MGKRVEEKVSRIQVVTHLGAKISTSHGRNTAKEQKLKIVSSDKWSSPGIGRVMASDLLVV